MDNKIIVLCGVPRSGTTILGRLMGSLKEVEYFNEPKTIDILLSLIDEMDENHWKLIFNRNIYDDLLINTLAGRMMNTNKFDDSSIYNYKTEDEINFRLSKSFRQLEIEPEARKKVIAFKLLNNALFTKKAQKYIPNLKPLFIIRNPNDTINSFSKKGWYSDAALSDSNPKPSSIFNVFKGFRIPNYVINDDYEKWISLSELERYAYYYIYMLKNMRIYLNDDSLFISYDDLISNSEKVLEKILNHYQLDRGEKTNEILSSIKYQPKKRENLLTHIPNTTQLELENIYNELIKYTKL